VRESAAAAYLSIRSA